MVNYSDTGLFLKETEQQIAIKYFNAWNSIMTLNGLETYTLQQYFDGNPSFFHSNAIQIDVQNETMIAMLQQKTVNYLISEQQNLKIQPRGGTNIGLTNALLAIEGIDEVVINNPNTTDPTTKGSVRIVINPVNYAEVNKFEIWNAIYFNLGVGIETIGDEFLESADDNNQLTTYNWDFLTNTTLFVKLYYRYSNNYKGERLSEPEIINNYIARFLEISKTGLDLEPASINDISYYPSIAYLDSEFSTDGGVNYLPRNQIIAGIYNIKYIVDVNSVIAEAE